jgi:hypothetical protein
MTLQPIPSEFPYTVYEENIIFYFYQCEVYIGNSGISLHLPSKNYKKNNPSLKI